MPLLCLPVSVTSLHLAPAARGAFQALYHDDPSAYMEQPGRACLLFPVQVRGPRLQGMQWLSQMPWLPGESRGTQALAKQ